MATLEQRDFVESLVAAANSGDVERWLACYAPDVTNHGRPAGREGMRTILGALYQVSPTGTSRFRRWSVKARTLSLS